MLLINYSPVKFTWLFNYKCYRGRYEQKKKIKFFYPRNDELISLIYSQSDEYWTNKINLIAKTKSRTERWDGLLFPARIYMQQIARNIFVNTHFDAYYRCSSRHFANPRNIKSFTSRQSQLIHTLTDTYWNW